MIRYDIDVFDTIGPRVETLMFETAARAEAAMQAGAAQVQQYAQSEAPWEDRTGDARQGLTAEVYDDGGEIVIELYHTAPHGYWLELIQDGEFAIIMPTLEQFGGEILRSAGAAALGSGS